MDEVEETSLTLIECAANAQADMIMFGSPGTEIFSPSMIETHVLSSSERYIQQCQRCGLFSLMHCCGRTRLLLERGVFDRVRPTIFESFTPSPLGDIPSPSAAAHQLPAQVFFKGGLSLDLLWSGTPEDVAEATRQAYADFGDRRFILAGTCAILVGTPRENLLAATETAGAVVGG